MNDMNESRRYAKVSDRITIPPLAPDNSADVTVMVSPHEIVLKIGSGRWVWPKHKWVEGPENPHNVATGDATV